jgi:hypothetical protein
LDPRGKRDGFHSDNVQEYGQLIELVNRLNAEWVLGGVA